MFRPDLLLRGRPREAAWIGVVQPAAVLTAAAPSLPPPAGAHGSAIGWASRWWATVMSPADAVEGKRALGGALGHPAGSGPRGRQVDRAHRENPDDLKVQVGGQ